MRVPILPVKAFLFVLFLSSFKNSYGQIGNVGFEVIEVTDYSQLSIDDSTNISFKLSIWYPSSPSQEKMTFKSYVQLLEDSETGLSVFLKSVLSRGASKANLEKLFRTEMNASYLAQPIGSWPVVFLLGSTKGYYWLPTAERLASNGYVVVSLPSLRYPANELANIQLAINKLNEKENVDLNNIGIVGYSTGGINALLLKMTNRRVKAVVTLEGADTQSEYMRTYNHLRFESHPMFSSRNWKTPTCVIFSGRGSYGRSRGYSTNFDFYDHTTNPYYLIEVANLHHEGGTGLAYFTHIEPTLISSNEEFSFKEDYEIVYSSIDLYFKKHLKEGDRRFSKSLLQDLGAINNARASVMPYTLQKVFMISNELINLNFLDEAFQLIQSAKHYYPESMKLDLLLAEIHLLNQNIDEALKMISKLELHEELRYEIQELKQEFKI